MAEASLGVTLPASENGLKATSSDTGLKTASLEDREEQFAVNRVVSVPLVTSLYELAPSSQESCSITAATCTLAENDVESSTAAAAFFAQLPPSERGSQTRPAQATRSNGLDKGKQTVPRQPPKQVVTQTTESDSFKETEAMPAEDSAAGGAKGAGTSSGKAARASHLGHSHLGGSTRAVMTSSLRSLMSSRVGQLFLRSVDRALDKSEELMNRYLPLTEKELAALTMEGLDGSAAERRKKGCFVRLGSLSTSLRNRAFILILNKLRQTRQNAHENLSQLHQTIDLIQHIQKKKLPGSQEKLRSMWEQWSQKQEGGPQSEPGGSKDNSAPASHGTDHNSPASSSKDSGSTHLEVESKALAMSRSLTQQLQGTYQNLMSNVRGLPAHLQEKMQQVHQNMVEVHGYFSSANSFQDLPGTILDQSREKVARAWEALDEVTDFLLQNPPVTWLVESLVSLEGELLETEEKDILKVLKHYEPQDCKDD